MKAAKADGASGAAAAISGRRRLGGDALRIGRRRCRRKDRLGELRHRRDGRR
jgi:hypothetical protein